MGLSLRRSHSSTRQRLLVYIDSFPDRSFPREFLAVFQSLVDDAPIQRRLCEKLIDLVGHVLLGPGLKAARRNLCGDASICPNDYGNPTSLSLQDGKAEPFPLTGMDKDIEGAVCPHKFLFG